MSIISIRSGCHIAGQKANDSNFGLKNYYYYFFFASSFTCLDLAKESMLL